MEEWITDRIIQRQNSPDLETIAAVFWQIWKARNRFVFNRQRPDPTLVVEAALAQVRTT